MSDFQGFADLEDWDNETAVADKPAKTVSPYSEDIGNVEVPGFVEKCPKCRGTGNWRPGYPCFKCKGKGKLSFKTSPEARGKARKYAQKRKQVKAEEAVAALPEIIREWLQTNAPKSGFAASLLSAVEKYGALTEKQEAAVYKCIAKDADAKVGWEQWCEAYPGVLDWLTAEDKAGNEFASSLLNAGQRYGSLTDGQLNAVQRNLDEGKSTSDAESDIDLSELHLGRAGSAWRSYFAVPDGETRLKLCIRRPGKNSRYYGWTFVDDGAEYGSRRTYGKQAPDGTYKGAVQDELRAILKDPMAASVAYGKLVGVCGVCGRALEDEESVFAGIGPVCASKL